MSLLDALIETLNRFDAQFLAVLIIEFEDEPDFKLAPFSSL